MHDHIHDVRSLSRRKLFRQSGAALAAAALTRTLSTRAYAGQSSTIRLALVGCGNRGTGAVADAFSTEGGPVRLVAMGDLFAHRMEASLTNLAKLFPDKIDVAPDRRFLGFDAYKKAIDCLGPGDVVLLTTHAAFRPLHFEYAVQKGINVFMEKSFAVDAPGVRRLLASAEASERKNLKVAAGFMWRHCKARQEVIRRIHDGAIGDLHTLRIYRIEPGFYCPRRPNDVSELMFQIQHACAFNWLAGGYHNDWHCHNIDVACWTKNAWPVAAQGFGGQCYAEAGNLLDHYAIEYTFADGAKLFAFSRHMNGCWQTYSDYAHGSKGSAVIMTNLATPKPRLFKGQRIADEDVVWQYGRKEPSPYREEWQRLVDAIREDKPHNEARRAAEANLVAIMGRMATHTGASMTWDEAMHSNFQYVHDIDRMTAETPAPIQPDANGTYLAPKPGLAKEV
jgi:predicted dehydrogenase